MFDKSNDIALVSLYLGSSAREPAMVKRDLSKGIIYMYRTSSNIEVRSVSDFDDRRPGQCLGWKTLVFMVFDELDMKKVHEHVHTRGYRQCEKTSR